MTPRHKENPFMWALAAMMLVGIVLMVLGFVLIVFEALAGIILTFYGALVAVSFGTWYFFLRKRR